MYIIVLIFACRPPNSVVVRLDDIIIILDIAYSGCIVLLLIILSIWNNINISYIGGGIRGLAFGSSLPIPAGRLSACSFVITSSSIRILPFLTK